MGPRRYGYDLQAPSSSAAPIASVARPVARGVTVAQGRAPAANISGEGSAEY
jgi:hypothetical protein